MKVGIVGFGDGGRCNLQSFLTIGNGVAAICDCNEKVLAEIREEFPTIHTHETLEKMLANERIDLVVIATPDDQHLLPTKKALEAGKYAFVEKPVATTLEDIKAFEDLTVQYPGKVLFSEKYSFAYPVQAALQHREALGRFLWGSTFYSMGNCDRIMGGGKWRTERAYNPCAGGLSHNFMTALSFVGSPIVRVRASGQVLSYHELNHFGGFDTMEGTLEFVTGQKLNWVVCLAVRGDSNPFGHRTVAHTFAFENGALAYGATPEDDHLVIEGKQVAMLTEPEQKIWASYNIDTLYNGMHINTLFSPFLPLHNIAHGINVAYTCCLAFKSAKEHNGAWIEVPGH